MLFNSFSFLLIFLPLVLMVALRLKGTPLLAWITLSSFVFYAFAGHAWFIVPMLVTTVVDFFLATLIWEAKTIRRKRFFLIVSLVANLGLLFYFKYAKLILGSFLLLHKAVVGTDLTRYPEWLKKASTLALPAGISFYTFQTISYVVDVWRKEAKPERNFWKFAGFVSFFPHLVAGPLTRHNQLIPGLTEIAANGIRARWREGVFLFVIGLGKKVLIADRFGRA